MKNVMHAREKDHKNFQLIGSLTRGFQVPISAGVSDTSVLLLGDHWEGRPREMGRGLQGMMDGLDWSANTVVLAIALRVTCHPALITAVRIGYKLRMFPVSCAIGGPSLTVGCKTRISRLDHK